MNSTLLLRIIALIAIFFSAHVSAGQTVRSVQVDTAPTIDGHAGDSAWDKSVEVITHDAVAGIDISLRSVHTEDEIFILVSFPDSTENRKHKEQLWDAEKEIYNIGPLREDTLVLKWNMEPFPVDISLTGDEPYSADIWYWKSYRTDHAGYADDKIQLYTGHASSKSQHLISKSGKAFFLTRKGDRGVSAYKNFVPSSFQGNTVSAYTLGAPAGSRADVRAKGQWRNGMWTVEFSRKLVTGNTDDVLLSKQGVYTFGVSRYEIAGRDINPDIEVPKFGSGDISEQLTLVFD